ncbi:DNA-directed RNA polymerase sigma-70 factor [Bryobacterales bacterium F-183]|nr:DNA-directed RNA polymerase sigma-70 factor [Bryobacterales bacterium F-183]
MDVTTLLQRAHDGDRQGLDAAMPLIYDELKRLASSHLRREGDQSPMAATTLVHEAYLRLVHANHPAYQNRAHFYSIASRVMRQVLVDAARARLTGKRNGKPPMQLDELTEFGTANPDRVVLAVNDAVDQLSRISEVKATLIEMHYFGGMTADECAEAKQMSVHMVRKELRLAQAWLRAEMAGGVR